MASSSNQRPRANRPEGKPPGVKLMVQPGKSSLLSRMAVWLLIAGTSILAGSLVVSGVRLIVDPYSENWLKTTFPALGPTDAAPVQSLQAIRDELQGEGLTLGTAVRWPVDNDRTDWIFPVLKRPSSCGLGETACATTVALRIYRPETGPAGEDLFKLINTINVQGPEESFVTAPLLGTASQVASVDRPAAISQLTLFETPYSERSWLMLEGQQKFGTTNIRYGQIFSYNPRSARVTTVLSWTSPTHKAPYFKDLDGTGKPEVVVDQTVGLEPRLQGYTFIDNQPPQLREISLFTSVYAEPPATSVYEKSLQLARSGVWSHALQMMETARETLGQDWTPAAESQLNLIAAHAQVAHDQTERNWSSRRQQTLAYLIDGQWERALADLEEKPISYQRMLDQFKTDFSRLWRRVQAHLEIHPTDEAAQVWGALLVTARQNPEAAEDWLKEQRRSKSAQERFDELLIMAKGGPSVLENLALGDETDPAADVELVANIPARYRRLLGEVQRVADPGPGWQRLGDAEPELIGDQAWYQVRIQMVGDERGWLPANSADLSGMGQNALPLLGLQTFSQLQLIAWNTDAQAAPTSVTVQGARLEGGQLVLLASGGAIANFDQSGIPALALSPNALQWLALGTPLPQFVQTQSSWNTALSSATSGPLGPYYTYLKASTLDVTGDSIPELLLRLDPSELPADLAARFASSRWPRTIILAATGETLYNDFDRSQSVVSLLPNSPASPVSLLIHDGPGYRLQRL
ncbi:MAG: hypothetical protein AAFN18_20015 [Cyanobacteria bacterium J06554_6]